MVKRSIVLFLFYSCFISSAEKTEEEPESTLGGALPVYLLGRRSSEGSVNRTVSSAEQILSKIALLNKEYEQRIKGSSESICKKIKALKAVYDNPSLYNDLCALQEPGEKLEEEFMRAAFSELVDATNAHILHIYKSCILRDNGFCRNHRSILPKLFSRQSDYGHSLAELRLKEVFQKCEKWDCKHEEEGSLPSSYRKKLALRLEECWKEKAKKLKALNEAFFKKDVELPLFGTREPIFDEVYGLWMENKKNISRSSPPGPRVNDFSKSKKNTVSMLWDIRSKPLGRCTEVEERCHRKNDKKMIKTPRSDSPHPGQQRPEHLWG